MRTSVIVCLLAGYAALLSARVGGAPSQMTAKGEKPPPDFARDVLPIIEDNCLRCHSAASQKGGLILDTHEDIMIGGENGTVLVAGDSHTFGVCAPEPACLLHTAGCRLKTAG